MKETIQQILATQRQRVQEDKEIKLRVFKRLSDINREIVALTDLKRSLNKEVRELKIQNKKILFDDLFTLDYILSVVSEVTGISEKNIKSKKRDRDFVFARHIYLYIAERHTTSTHAKIANLVNLIHSSVHTTLLKIEGFLEIEDPQTTSIINEIEAML